MNTSPRDNSVSRACLADLRRYLRETSYEKNRFPRLVVTVPDARIALVNTAFERTFGWKRAEVEGKEVHILVPEGKALEHYQHVERYMKSPIAMYMGYAGRKQPFPCQKKDKSTFQAIIELEPINLVDHGDFIDVTLVPEEFSSDRFAGR